MLQALFDIINKVKLPKFVWASTCHGAVLRDAAADSRTVRLAEVHIETRTRVRINTKLLLFGGSVVSVACCGFEWFYFMFFHADFGSICQSGIRLRVFPNVTNAK